VLYDDEFDSRSVWLVVEIASSHWELLVLFFFDSTRLGLNVARKWKMTWWRKWRSYFSTVEETNDSVWWLSFCACLIKVVWLWGEWFCWNYYNIVLVEIWIFDFMWWWFSEMVVVCWFRWWCCFGCLKNSKMCCGMDIGIETKTYSSLKVFMNLKKKCWCSWGNLERRMILMPKSSCCRFQMCFFREIQCRPLFMQWLALI
jgi:hypothetical protein